MNLTNLHATIKAIVKDTIQMGEQPIIPHLKGPPGCGKTEIVLQVCKELGIPCFILNLTAKEPVDLTGLPEVEEVSIDGVLVRSTVWRTPKIFPRKGPAVIFYDEIDACDTDVQKAISSLICEKQLDEYHVPKGVCQIMAGNRKQDRCGVVAKMPAHLCNRRTRIDVTVDLDSWRKWAANHGVDPRIIAFSRIKPDSMYVFDPKSDEDAFATLRSMTAISKTLGMIDRHKLNAEIQSDLFMGTVGKGVASEVDRILTSIKLMPNPDELLGSPQTVVIPTENIDIMFAIGEFMVYHAMRDDKHIDSALIIADRLPEEQGMILVTTLYQEIKNKVLASPLYSKWAVKMAKLSA
jgi:hypothetical protein